MPQMSARSRRIRFSVFALLFPAFMATIAHAAETRKVSFRHIPAARTLATCDLGISVSCTPAANGQSSTCTAITLNNAADACTGLFFVGYEAEAAGATLSNFNSGLPPDPNTECFTEPDPSTPIAFCFGPAALPGHASMTSSVSLTGAPSVPILAFTFVEDPNDPEGPGTFVFSFANADLPTCTPATAAPPISQSGLDYTVSWSATKNPSTTYEVTESTSSDFTANVATKTVSGTSTTFSHSVSTTTTFFYRVRATNCDGTPGPFSATVSTTVQAPPPPTSHDVDTAVPFGSTQPVSFQLFIPGSSGPTTAGVKPLDNTFTATTDKPFLTVTPSGGALPPTGTTVTVTGNPSNLPPGASTGTVTVTPSNQPPVSKAVSLSLVTPVLPGSKSLPPPNALIIPVITHVNSASATFQSDVRVSNLSPSAINYQLTFVPIVPAGSTSAPKITTVSIAPGQTIAFNDVAKDFFGIGATGATTDQGAGSLEIRPLNNPSFLTFASSRTFATVPAGTLGQFLAAIPFSQFAGQATNVVPTPGVPPTTGPIILSLQQVAESAKFRMNLGLVEGSGTPANGTIRVFDDNGTLLKEVPYSLKPGELQQMNQFISRTAGISNLDDGRIEITVDSTTGAISAYASVLDNLTQDPLAVNPVQVSKVNARRYTLPGVAEFTSPVSNFHSDVRIYNGGSTAVTATLTYFEQGSGTPTGASKTITIGAGQVKAIDNILPSLFGLNGPNGGSIVVTTPTDSSLVLTDRTYSIDLTGLIAKGGTFGQFVPGVTAADGVGLGERPLQILQLEESPRFRSNIGLVELTGNPANVKVTVTPSDGRTTGIFTTELAGNEFLQVVQLLKKVYGNAAAAFYNARVTVEVTGGSGRVMAYGSVLDNATTDPTYVPAQ